MKEVEVLKFSFNWNNKLNCEAFSTIRLNSNKYQVGKKLAILLTENKLERVFGEAEIVYVKTFLLKDLNEPMARLDTGYSKQECTKLIEKIYSRSRIDLNKSLLAFVVLSYNNQKIN
jgi:hypothetical protein